MNPENQKPEPADPNQNPAQAPQAAQTPNPPNTFAQQFETAPAAPPAVASPLSRPAPTDPSGGLTDWPGAFAIFKYSKDAVIKNIAVLIIFGVVFGSINLGLGFVGDQDSVAAGIAVQIIATIMGTFATVGTSLAYVHGVRGKELPIGEAFSKSIALFLKMFVLQILVSLAALASLLLLIVPFFFVFPRLLLSQYYLVDKNMGPVEAFQASWDTSKGHVGKVYGIVGVSILMFLPVITLIGIIATIILLFLYSAAYAVLYQYVLNTQGQQSGGPLRPVTPAAPSAPSAPNAPNAPNA